MLKCPEKPGPRLKSTLRWHQETQHACSGQCCDWLHILFGIAAYADVQARRVRGHAVYDREDEVVGTTQSHKIRRRALRARLKGFASEWSLDLWVSRGQIQPAC
jgi:hypothetical protein